jgi:hypothetical protein
MGWDEILAGTFQAHPFSWTDGVFEWTGFSIFKQGGFLALLFNQFLDVLY